MLRLRTVQSVLLLLVVALLLAGWGIQPVLTVAEQPTPTMPGIAPGVHGQIAEDVPFVASPIEATRGSWAEPLSPPYYDITLNVPAYSQNGGNWWDDIMQTCGTSIAEEGCLLTSSTMVFRYYGSSKNPGQVNTCMGNNACPWVWATGASSCSEGHANYYGQVSPTNSNLVWALASGYPAILGMRNASGGMHWVVVNRIRGYGLTDGDFYIIDPWDGAAKGLTAYTSHGYTKTCIAIYTPR